MLAVRAAAVSACRFELLFFGDLYRGRLCFRQAMKQDRDRAGSEESSDDELFHGHAKRVANLRYKRVANMLILRCVLRKVSVKRRTMRFGSIFQS